MEEPVGSENVSPVELEGKPQPGSSKLLLALLLVGATAIILFLGIYLGRTYFAPRSANSPSTVLPTSTPSQSADHAPELLANWVLYENKEKGFAFMYPPNMEILNNSTRPFSNYEPQSWLTHISDDPQNPLISFSVSIRDDPKDDAGKSILSLGDISVENPERAMFAGRSVVKYSYTSVVGKDDQARNITKGIIMLEQGSLWHIMLTIRDQSSSRQTGDQILSTFRFLDSQSYSGECGVCGAKGMHNLEGKVCASGFICKSSSEGTASSGSFCVRPDQSIDDCI